MALSNSSEKLFPIFFVLLSCLILVFPGQAANSDPPIWTKTNGISGGNFHVLEIDPQNPDIMYAGSGYALFRSDDRAESWSRVDALHVMGETEELGVRSVVFDPVDSNVVYVACRGGVFKSIDDGVSWIDITPRGEFREAHSVSVDPDDPSTVYAVLSHGGQHYSMFKSTNGGSNWVDISDNLPTRDNIVFVKVLSRSRVFIGGGFEMAREGELYLSNDGGNSWGIMDVGQGDESFPNLIRVDPSDPTHFFICFSDAYNRGRQLREILFETRDDGETFSPVHGGEIGSGIADIEISPIDPDVIYYLSPLHVSRDGGMTWHRIDSGSEVLDFGHSEQNSIALDPENENVLFSTLLGQGISKSVDGGETWWLSTNGLVSTMVTNLATDPVDPDTVYACGGDGSGTWKSIDGGETWEVQNKNGIHHPWVDELYVVPSEPLTLYDVADTGLIFRTVDGGETWTDYNNHFFHESIYAMAAHPSNPNIVYAMNNGFGVFKSEESCQHWNYQLYSPDYSYSLAVDPEEPDIVYSGYTRKVFENSSRIYQTIDGGGEWEVVFEIPNSTAVTSVAVDAQNPDRVYAGSIGPIGEIYVTEDKGSSWRKVTNDFIFSTFHAQNQLTVDPHDPLTVYAAPWGASLFTSKDGGNSWSQVMGCPTVSISSLTMADNSLYIADRLSPRLYVSPDGGASWSLVFDAGPSFSRMNKVVVDPSDPSIVYVSVFGHNAVQGKIFKIEDGDATDITGVLPRSVIDIAVDPSDHDVIYISLHGECVYKSTNGGEAWENLEGMPIVGVFDLEIPSDDPNTIYSAAMGGRQCPPELLYPEMFPPVPEENIGTGGLYKSIDSGETWVKLSAPEAKYQAIVSDSVNNRLYAGFPGGVIVSLDEGVTWTSQNDGLDFIDIGSLDVSGDHVYAGTRGGGVYSGSIGSSVTEIDWRPTSGPYPEIFNIQIQVDPSDSQIVYASSYPGGMYKSTDGGVTWADKNFFLPSLEVTDPLRQGYYLFRVDPNNPDRIIFGVYGKGVYVSMDGANNQMPLFGDDNEMRGLYITDIAFHPTDPDVIYVSSEDGVYVTYDSGESWMEISEGLVVKDIKTLEFTADSTLIAGSKGYGIYKLGEDGEKWMGPYKVENYGVFWHVWDRPLYLYNALLANPFDTQILYLGTFPSGFYKSIDGGLTWREINTNFTVDGAFSLAFHPYNKNILLAGTYNGVSITEDAGETWSLSNFGMHQELWVFSIVYDPLNPDVVYATAKNGENQGNGVEGYHGVVMKSLDGGHTWVDIMDGLDYNFEYFQLVMYPYDYDVLFVSCGQGVYMTKDGGESWSPINSGLTLPNGVIGTGIVNNVANNLALNADATHLYLGTQARGVYKADLSLLELEPSPDALPVSCFNFVQDNGETGVDTGGFCIVDDGEYIYGVITEVQEPEEPEEEVTEPMEPETPDTEVETEEEEEEPEPIDITQEEADDGYLKFPPLQFIAIILVVATPLAYLAFKRK